MSILTPTLLLLNFHHVFPQPACTLGWKGYYVNPVDDCHIEEDRFKINISLLVSDTRCIKTLSVVIANEMVGSYSNIGEYKTIHYWWGTMCEAQTLEVIVEDMSGVMYETRSLMEPGKCEDKRQECESWTTEHTVIQSTSSNVIVISPEYTQETVTVSEDFKETVTVSEDFKETVTKSEDFKARVAVTETSNDWVKETSKNESPVMIAVIALSVLLLLVDAVYLIIKLKKKAKKNNTEDKEKNPTYGMYYMGDGDEGEETDIVMVEDRNVYYSSEGELGDVVLHDNNEHYASV